MTSSQNNVEKNLLQQITYLTRLIEQSKNASSRRLVVPNNSTEIKELKNQRHNILRLNTNKNKIKYSTSAPQSCNNDNLSYTKLKVLNKKNSSPKLSSSIPDPDKISSIKCEQVVELLDTSLASVVKKNIHVNRKKLCEKFKNADGNQCHKNNVYVNPAKFQLKCDNNMPKLNDIINDKEPSKNVHINPKFKRDSIHDKDLAPKRFKLANPTQNNPLIFKSGNTQLSREVPNEKVQVLKNVPAIIHFNKHFIDKTSGVYNASKFSKPLEDEITTTGNQLELPASTNINNSLLNNSPFLSSLGIKNDPTINCSVKPIKMKTSSESVVTKYDTRTQYCDKKNIDLQSNTIPDKSSSKTVSKSIQVPPVNSLKLLKLRRTMMKNQIIKSINNKQLQNLSLRNSLVHKNSSSLPVRKYKNSNKVININKYSNTALRKINNHQVVAKAGGSNKFINNVSKNMKLVNKNRLTLQRSLLLSKRSNSNLKLINLSKTKLIRVTSNILDVNKKGSGASKLLGKINKNSPNNKRNKRVWIAPGKNIQTHSVNLKPDSTVTNSNKLNSPYKFNSKIRLNCDKVKYKEVSTSSKTSPKEISHGKFIPKQKLLSRRLSENSNLVSISRTKLIRKSNSEIRMSQGTSRNKVNNLLKNKMLSGNNKTLNNLVPTKLSPTLWTARLIKTKYKLIRNSNISRTKIDWNHLSRRNQKFNCKLKMNKVLRSSSRYRKKSVTIGGINYHTTQMKLRRKFPVKEGKVYANKIFRNKGQSYRVGKCGRSLKRISSSEIRRRQTNQISKSYSRYRYNAFSRTDFPHYRVVQAKQKSIAILTRKLRKCNEPCLIFNRLGQCSAHKRGICNRLHDQKRVAICKKFLQGTCEKKACLLSHDVGPSKMPTCRHYLAGVCVRDDCPYLHVKVNSSAPVCISFLQGFCPDAGKCKKRHVAVCPAYEDKGVCPKGKSCPYPHPNLMKFPRHSCLNTHVISEKNSVIERHENKYQNNNSEEVVEADSKPSRYYIQPDYTQSQVTSVKRNSEDNMENLAGNEWLKKRPKIGDLPGFIPLDADSNLS